MGIVWIFIALFAVAIIIFFVKVRVPTGNDLSRRWISGNQINTTNKVRDIEKGKRAAKKFFVSPKKDFSKLNKYDPTNPTGKGKYIVHQNHRNQNQKVNNQTYLNSNSYKKTKPNEVVKKNEEEEDLLFANLDKSISGKKIENKPQEQINNFARPSSSNDNLIFSPTDSKIKDAKTDLRVKIQVSNKVVNNDVNEDLLFSVLDKSISCQKVQKFKPSINEEFSEDIPFDGEDISGGLF